MVASKPREAPKSQLATGLLKEQQTTHDTHIDAGYKNINSTCVSTSAPPEVRDVQLGMSHTSDGEHDSRGEENPSEDELKGAAGSKTAPGANTGTVYSTNQERDSWRSSPEIRNGHPGSLSSAASSGSPNGLSMLWQDLRDKHADVLRDRMSFRDLRAALDARQKAIDDEQAQLLQAMTAALTESATPTMKDVVDGFHALQTLRQALRSDIEALEKRERKSIADEEVMAELEEKVDAELLSLNDFPEGFLDFTQDPDPETESIASIRAVAPFEKEEYDLCLKEVNVIRERLLHMRSENEQLLREQEKRRQLGRELDVFSLQALNEFEDRLGGLTLELGRAQAMFELAKMNWISRKERMEREEDDWRAAQPLPPEEPSRITFEEGYDLQATHEDTNDCLESLEESDEEESDEEESDERASAIAETLFQTENVFYPVYELPCEAANGEAISKARFINQWLLQRIQLSPIVTRHFVKYLANAFTYIDTQKLVELALQSWLDDNLEEDFLANVNKGEESRAEKPSATSCDRPEWAGTNNSGTSSDRLEWAGTNSMLLSVNREWNILSEKVKQICQNGVAFYQYEPSSLLPASIVDAEILKNRWNELQSATTAYVNELLEFEGMLAIKQEMLDYPGRYNHGKAIADQHSRSAETSITVPLAYLYKVNLTADGAKTQRELQNKIDNLQHRIQELGRENYSLTSGLEGPEFEDLDLSDDQKRQVHENNGVIEQYEEKRRSHRVALHQLVAKAEILSATAS